MNSWWNPFGGSSIPFICEILDTRFGTVGLVVLAFSKFFFTMKPGFIFGITGFGLLFDEFSKFSLHSELE